MASDYLCNHDYAGKGAGRCTNPAGGCPPGLVPAQQQFGFPCCVLPATHFTRFVAAFVAIDWHPTSRLFVLDALHPID